MVLTDLVNNPLQKTLTTPYLCGFPSFFVTDPSLKYFDMVDILSAGPGNVSMYITFALMPLGGARESIFGALSGMM